MEQEKTAPATIDEYIAGCPAEVRPLLRQMRETIRNAAPEAEEKISWGMATFVCHGNLVHFSAERRHIGFHPAPTAIEAFRARLEGFSCSKGTVRLPYDRPLPLELIGEMVRFRVAEQTALAEAKKAGRSAPAAEAARRARCPMPDDVAGALDREGLRAHYDARPPYQRNDYLGWITRAKRTETRKKRLDQMLEELRGGDAYMGTPYRAKRPEREDGE